MSLAAGSPTPAPGLDWDAAIRAHGPRVVASLLALRLPFDHAEDLASQAWARLIEEEKRGALPEIKLPGLAIKQARFLALTALKDQRREVDPGSKPDALVAPGDPERALIARQDVERALAVLATCSASAQAVFHHMYDDPPPRHEVVAARVGLSVQRVRQILCEVRRKLREALEERP